MNKMKLAVFVKIKPHATQGLETQSGVNAVNVTPMIFLFLYIYLHEFKQN